jgi:hypothetical protein
MQCTFMYLKYIHVKYTLCTTLVYLSKKILFLFEHAALLPELTNGTNAMELRVVRYYMNVQYAILYYLDRTYM